MFPLTLVRLKTAGDRVGDIAQLPGPLKGNGARFNVGRINNYKYTKRDHMGLRKGAPDQ